MKLALLADIHGNYTALKAVLDDAYKQNVSGYLVAGDHIGDGPNPKEVVDAIRTMENCWVIKGNKEERIISYRKGNHPEWTDFYQTSVFVWTSRQLDDGDIEYLDNLPIQRTVMFEGMPGIKMVHGSVKNAAEVIDDKSSNVGRVYEILNEIDEQVLVYGHSHTPRALKYNNKIAINPGSVGLSFNEGAKAEYAILELTGDSWNCKQMYVDYDKEELKREFYHSGLINHGGAWAKCTLQSMLQGKDIALAFLKEAYQLARIKRYSCTLVPNEIWLEVEKSWRWEY